LTILKITTQCEFKQSTEIIWQGITNAIMEFPKPFCFNLGVPLPVKCEITNYTNGVGKTRRCTSDKGCIEQVITVYQPNERLAFRMESHNLKTKFKIGQMDDEFIFTKLENGITRLQRTTNIAIPEGFGLSIRSWAIGKSIRNVHQYVYNNIKMTY
jgi:hypothetical protein